MGAKLVLFFVWGVGNNYATDRTFQAEYRLRVAAWLVDEAYRRSGVRVSDRLHVSSMLFLYVRRLRNIKKSQYGFLLKFLKSVF